MEKEQKWMQQEEKANSCSREKSHHSDRPAVQKPVPQEQPRPSFQILSEATGPKASLAPTAFSPGT